MLLNNEQVDRNFSCASANNTATLSNNASRSQIEVCSRDCSMISAVHVDETLSLLDKALFLAVVSHHLLTPTPAYSSFGDPKVVEITP